LSESWPLDVAKGDQRSYPVRLSHDWLFPPLERKPEETHLPLDLGGRTDLMVITHNSLRRLHGATGQPAWPGPFALDEKKLPAGRDAKEWEWIQRTGGFKGHFGRLLQPAPDLDKDGVGDLIFPAGAVYVNLLPALLAVSGKDGRPLWWFSSGYGERDKERPLENADTIDRPAVADVDGDGTPDLITLFVNAQRRTWVEAISGRTGKSPWKRQLGMDWL